MPPPLAGDAGTTTLRTILVATDGSADSRGAVAAAGRLAAAGGAAVHLLSVCPPPLPIAGLSGWMVTDDVYESAYSEFEGIVEADRRVLEAAGATVAGVRVLVGSPAQTIGDHAAAVEADLVVVGAHAHGAVGRILAGSVSEGLVHHCHVPVLVVRGRPGCGDPRHVVAGVDGSAASHRAAALAAVLAGALGARLTLLHIRSGRGDDAGVDDAALAALAVELRGAAGSPVETSSVAGDAADVLCTAASEDGVLLAVGRRGLGAVRGALLGSVSERLLHYGACTVLVVPPEHARTRAAAGVAERAVAAVGGGV